MSQKIGICTGAGVAGAVLPQPVVDAPAPGEVAEVGGRDPAPAREAAGELLHGKGRWGPVPREDAEPLTAVAASTAVAITRSGVASEGVNVSEVAVGVVRRVNTSFSFGIYVDRERLLLSSMPAEWVKHAVFRPVYMLEFARPAEIRTTMDPLEEAAERRQRARREQEGAMRRATAHAVEKAALRRTDTSSL